MDVCICVCSTILLIGIICSIDDLVNTYMNHKHEQIMFELGKGVNEDNDKI